jgi:hypothetical protein
MEWTQDESILQEGCDYLGCWLSNDQAHEYEVVTWYKGNFYDRAMTLQLPPTWFAPITYPLDK